MCPSSRSATRRKSAQNQTRQNTLMHLLVFLNIIIVAFKPWPVKPWLDLPFLGKLMTFREVMRNNTIEEVRATLAINLRTIRLSKGIAQERLALDAGVDRTVVSKIERAVTNPSIEILLKLANHLDVDLNDLFVNQ